MAELARVLPKDLGANIWLVYFDAEDNGSLPGGEWVLGSRAFVESLEASPDAVVILEVFAKKTNKTPKRFIEVSQKRLNLYREIIGK